MTRRNKQPAPPPAAPVPPIAPPYTYWTLAETLREQRDLVTATGPFVPSPTCPWRILAGEVFAGRYTSNNLSSLAGRWALYLHPATDAQILRAMRRRRMYWAGWSGTDIRTELVRMAPMHNGALSRLFLHHTVDAAARRQLATILKLHDWSLDEP